MTEDTEPGSNRRRNALAAASIALVGAGAGWLIGSHSLSGNQVASGDKAAIEQVVRSYILEHPEILPEAMERLRAREDAKALASVSDVVKTPFPGAILGNPNGTVTLVEFTDFACTYCRQSVADVEALIAANPDLKVVIRELPILSPQSADAARMALAAAEQGRYLAFHRAMFALGRPDAQTITAAARQAGLDLERASRFIADPKVEAEINRNLDIARQLGFTGTPAWVVGDAMLSGAVGQAQLAQAIEEARG